VFSKPNNQVWHQFEFNTCQEAKIYFLVFIQVEIFHPRFSSLFSSSFWMKKFHPSMIFDLPYLPHISSNLSDYRVIGSFWQVLRDNELVATFGDCDFGSLEINFPIFGIYFT
jgi:hypothetical protein